PPGAVVSEKSQLEPGDYFVILSPDWLYWDGQAWVRDRRLALRFAGPVDPSAEAQRVADGLRQGSQPCNVAYVPAAKVAAGQVPEPRGVGGHDGGVAQGE